MAFIVRPLRAGLIVARSLQVALAIAIIIASSILVNILSTDIDILKSDWKVGIVRTGIFTTAYGVAEGTSDYPVNEDVQGLLAGSIIHLFISILTFCFVVPWLIYTIFPKARARASCGADNTCCMHYTCEIFWDVVLAVIYFTMFVVSLAYSLLDVDNRISYRLSVFQILYTAIFTMLFIASAVLAGEMRHRELDHEHEVARAHAGLKHAPIINQRISFVDRVDPGFGVQPPVDAVTGDDIVVGPAADQEADKVANKDATFVSLPV